ncbi:MAG: preprotein translocase subunit SecE [Verrucomicrobiota bacterium]|jgi:preprotein translocase subunit SecE|nr:preprotein translocase subunit SecE [Verrucomicrobiota bacterium]MDD8044865.1 preprotein translocase subunit SecE [Verrucomicrobiota bacterium]MDD8049799.1 preprotein translocase subunit SecE [Verrucomicrobiota bacterium]MDI9384065.1 preprotein translocase subunit SecE [Verrucomicrobiota bacterium]HCF95306.1 preprotein translocase subunit SecE [Verrucomicrobiota bacterium]
MSVSTTKHKKAVAGRPSIFKRVQRFWEEMIQELRKSVWPSRPELMESTMVVIVSVVLVAVYVAICDFVFQLAMRLLF